MSKIIRELILRIMVCHRLPKQMRYQTALLPDIFGFKYNTFEYIPIGPAVVQHFPHFSRKFPQFPSDEAQMGRKWFLPIGPAKVPFSTLISKKLNILKFNFSGLWGGMLGKDEIY